LNFEAWLREREAAETFSPYFFQRLRQRIRTGRYSPEGLYSAFVRRASAFQSQNGFDELDALADGLLGLQTPQRGSAVLGAEMVPYQPTPLRQILALVDEARLGPDDTFLDLGSGLGQVALLASLFSGCRAHGIEIDSAYVAQARRAATGLGLKRVSFEEGDLLEAPLSEASLYYLYTPLTGKLLEQLLERLRKEAGKRLIKIAALGPCASVLQLQDWLTFENFASSGRQLCFYQSH
jgi:SAM-dependent methyltransferase